MSLFRPSIGLLFNTTTRVLPAISSRFYHEKVIDHYEKPRNVGKLDAKKSSVGTGLVGAPACGDVMKLQIEVDENGKIIDAKFKTFGCGHTLAANASAAYRRVWLPTASSPQETVASTQTAKPASNAPTSTAHLNSRHAPVSHRLRRSWLPLRSSKPPRSGASSSLRRSLATSLSVPRVPRP